ncbi:MAG: glutamyl-tRNA reductase [Chitinophagia bacterium]|nr:glutamyl-tRNA reductase [Chitinophagia bacterium]
MQQFWLIGLSYRNANTSLRGQFAMNKEQCLLLLEEAGKANISEIFVLSTCNRTEIYARCADSATIVNLFCQIVNAPLSVLEDYGYIYNDEKAIHHLYKVATGLDSQILGDFEILGQLKESYKWAKDAGTIGTFTDRLLNNVFQCAKSVKTHTAISSGTVSVSFAALQYIKDNVNDIEHKTIVLVGLGNIGQTTYKNILDYLPQTSLVLINRTYETGRNFAAEQRLPLLSINEMDSALNNAHVLIVATNASKPLITADMLRNKPVELVIDLSVPCNVEQSVYKGGEFKVVNVDDLSQINDEALERRKQEVPHVLNIIQEHYAEFKKWYYLRKYIPIINGMKEKQTLVNSYPFFTSTTTLPLPNTFNTLMQALSAKPERHLMQGCTYIEALNDVIAQYD